MPTRAICCLGWLAGVTALFVWLPPTGWGAGDGLAFILGLLAVSGMSYGVLALSVLLEWLCRRIEGAPVGGDSCQTTP